MVGGGAGSALVLVVPLRLQVQADYLLLWQLQPRTGEIGRERFPDRLRIVWDVMFLWSEALPGLRTFRLFSIDCFDK